MSSQRGQRSVRATSPDQHKAPAKANRKKSKEQRDHQTSDIKEKSTERAEDDGAPKRESGKRQNKKEKDPRDCESEDKPRETEEKPSAASRRSSVPNKAGENDRQDSAKSKPQKTAKSKPGEKTAPTRQSKKKRDPSKLGREESLQSSESKSQDRPDCKKKSAEKPTAVRGHSVDDTLGKVLKATIYKLKIKKCELSKASSCVNDITDKVIAHLKQNTIWCTDIERLRTGSYYENLKVSVAL